MIRLSDEEMAALFPCDYRDVTKGMALAAGTVWPMCSPERPCPSCRKRAKVLAALRAARRGSAGGSSDLRR